ncbi:hypothetical protein [Thermophilibacter immobilis]|uniref:Glycosyltransferase family 2 protein n=1 Tax=Thermophilibacter immobilis TaxID=2779519 RepID=A0A7S7M9S3_9ACTN|nr:hypothetical protein [Thermophilibacter immobilis]QOY61362.1 hypothetical protein INP52_04030 [Thermophilibacter immobilis]
MGEIHLGIGFATGRRNFRKVLSAYIHTWRTTKCDLPAGTEVRLHLFVAYDVEYRHTKSTDYTNLPQDLVDAFDSITFVGAKNSYGPLERLRGSGDLTRAELRSVFGAGYAGKRNAALFAALESRMDYFLFLDDDEYPMAVAKTHETCIWCGQRVLTTHLREIGEADYTNGLHCGYVSPIPQISFDGTLGEGDFRRFVEAISNDIVSWDSIRSLMESDGVTYATPELLISRESQNVPLVGGCRFISGANLCINLRDPHRTLPFFNPPGARGEDTFLSTLLEDRTVRRIPTYTFHDGFAIYQHLLDGVLPIHLSEIQAGSPSINTRFLNACVGWVRYKPLLTYLTAPQDYEKKMRSMHEALDQTLPALAEYFQDRRFFSITTELDKYAKNVEKHARRFELSQSTWQKIVDHL